MSIATVVTLGYGTFGSVNRIPTVGYGGGAVSPPAVPGMECRAEDNRFNARAANNRFHTRSDNNQFESRGLEQ